MADPDDRDKAAEPESLEKSVADTLASARNTLDQIGVLNKKWEELQQKFTETLAVSLQTAFGLEPTCTLTGDEQSAVLGGNPTLEELCRRLGKGEYKRVVVMVGAGVSVAAGIPDFRSPGSGLYDTLKGREDLPSPESVFDIEFFRRNPKPFFSLAKELYPGQHRPTAAHYFIRLLFERGILLRCYTQNIDTLERLAGVPDEALVEAHGSFARARCTSPGCGKDYSAEEVKAEVFSDQIPTCTECAGVVKPCIVFFGEPLPVRFKDLYETDLGTCDLLIVMGTSLRVAPFAGLVYRVPQTTPRLLINRERVGKFTLKEEGGYRDVALFQDCESAVWRVCDACGWSRALEQLMGQEKTTQETSSSHKCH